MSVNTGETKKSSVLLGQAAEIMGELSVLYTSISALEESLKPVTKEPPPEEVHTNAREPEPTPVSEKLEQIRREVGSMARRLERIRADLII